MASLYNRCELYLLVDKNTVEKDSYDGNGHEEGGEESYATCSSPRTLFVNAPSVSNLANPSSGCTASSKLMGHWDEGVKLQKRDQL